MVGLTLKRLVHKLDYSPVLHKREWSPSSSSSLLSQDELSSNRLRKPWFFKRIAILPTALAAIVLLTLLLFSRSTTTPPELVPGAPPREIFYWESYPL